MNTSKSWVKLCHIQFKISEYKTAFQFKIIRQIHNFLLPCRVIKDACFSNLNFFAIFYLMRRRKRARAIFDATFMNTDC